MQTFSWHLENNINDLRNLFSEITLPYKVVSYICMCGYNQTSINYYESMLDKYICPNCENEEFYDANKYGNNSFWYEPITNLLNEDYISSLYPIVKYDEKNKILKAIIQIDIPNYIDLASDKIVYKQKDLFEIQIDEFGNIKQIVHVNFDLKAYLTENEKKYYDYISDEELKNRNPFIIDFKKKILNAFTKNSNYFKSKILHKTNSLEEFSFFVNNSHLQDTEFYKWKNIDLIIDDKEFKIVDALEFVLNYRTEKTLKKLVFENYKTQLRNYGCYEPIYTYSITKFIKDVNILNRMINIDLKSSIDEMHNPFALCEYMKFLTKIFTDKQIEKLFLSYEKKEIFWLIDTVAMFNEVIDYLDEFIPSTCKVEVLHDEIIRFHQMVLNKHLIDVKFDYEDKFTNACTNIENYQIKLPFNGIELYEWSSKLQNCLSGYWKTILEKRTIVYGFFINDEIKFAVEIKNNKIIQSKLKYNQDLQNRDMNLVMGWFKEYFEEKKENEKTYRQIIYF